MNTSALLRNAARVFGECPALSVGDELRFTYAQLHERAARLGGALRSTYRLAPGARVLLAMSNSPVYLEVLFAAWEAGLVVVPVNAKLHPREMAYIADNCQAALCLATEELAHGVEAALRDAALSTPVVCVDHPDYEKLLRSEALPSVDSDPSDLAWIFYTSGTTGKPKGAMLSHLNLQVMSWSFLADMDSVTEKDSMLHLGPLSHASGLLALPGVSKAAHHVLPASGGFDPAEIASLLNHYTSMSFFAAPTMARRLLESPQIAACKLDHLRTILGGAAPFYRTDVKRIIEAFPGRFTNGYGQGECPATITGMPKGMYASLEEGQLDSVGIARSGVEIKVVGEDGQTVSPGEVGEIIVRSPIVMQGYWNNEEATKSAIRNGWLYTGDVGTLDARGLLYLKDRSKDLIISGGSNIYPREVEDVLLLHPGVAEAAVIGEADPEWGEIVVACIVAKAGATVRREELDRLCLENLARFKRPKQYVFLEAMPRNVTGKILKTALRESVKTNG